MKIFSPHSWLENAQGLQWYVPIFACGIIIALIEDETAKSYSTIKNYTADLILLLTTLTVVVMIPIVRNLLFGSEVDTSLTRKYLFFGFVAAIQLYALLNSKIVKKLYDSMTVVQWIGKMGCIRPPSAAIRAAFSSRKILPAPSSFSRTEGR